MLCKKCNFENDAAAKFCENCGAALQAKNPVQANKSLKKIIWGCVALLYVISIVIFCIKPSYNSTASAYNKYSDIVSKIRERIMPVSEQREMIENEQYNMDRLQNRMYELDSLMRSIASLLRTLAFCMVVLLIVLLISKKVKLSFAITAILLCIYAVLGGHGRGLIMLLGSFCIAIVTTLVYKYSFAENQKLL